MVGLDGWLGRKDAAPEGLLDKRDGKIRGNSMTSRMAEPEGLLDHKDCWTTGTARPDGWTRWMAGPEGCWTRGIAGPEGWVDQREWHDQWNG
jgi:hypothetical protein